jgi:hypothetical protein
MPCECGAAEVTSGVAIALVIDFKLCQLSAHPSAECRAQPEAEDAGQKPALGITATTCAMTTASAITSTQSYYKSD